MDHQRRRLTLGASALTLGFGLTGCGGGGDAGQGNSTTGNATSSDAATSASSSLQSQGFEYVKGLVAGDASKRIAQANARQLQSQIAPNKKLAIPSGMGTVYFDATPQSTPYGIILLPDHLALDIGAGTDLSIVPPEAGATPLLCNANARSNKLAVTGIEVKGMDSALKYSICVATIPKHTFKTGDYFQIKKETSGYYNYIWRVESVTATTVTFYAMSYSRFPNGTGNNIVAYPANAFISITGEGSIGGAYNLGASGIGLVNLCAVLFNKVLACNYRVRSTRSFQRGVQFVNFYDCEVAPNSGVMNIESAAVGSQWTGPGRGVYVSRISGGNSDDKVAVLTCDTTGAQFHDADGSLNCGGDIDNVVIENIDDHGNSTRTIMLGADGTGRLDNVTLRNVHRVHRGSGLLLEAYCEAVFGSLTLESPSVTTHGQGGAIIALTGGGGTYEFVKVIDLSAGNVVEGSAYKGLCDTSVLDFSANASGTVLNLLIERPNIKVDLDHSARETVLLGGGHTSNWRIDRIALMAPNITCAGNNGRLTVIGPGMSGNCDVTLSDGVIKGRSGSVLFTSRDRTYTLRASGTTVSGFDQLVGGAGQANIYTAGGLDVSGTFFGLVGTYGTGTPTSHLTFNIYCSQTIFGNAYVTGGIGAYTDVHFWSSGGNNSQAWSPFYNWVQNDGGASNHNTYNLHGNCADWCVDLDKIARTPGCIVQVRNAIGTIKAGELAVCDASGVTGSWKQLSDTRLSY